MSGISELKESETGEGNGVMALLEWQRRVA